MVWLTSVCWSGCGCEGEWELDVGESCEADRVPESPLLTAERVKAVVSDDGVAIIAVDDVAHR